MQTRDILTVSSAHVLAKQVPFLQGPRYPQAKSYIEALLEGDLWLEKPFSRQCIGWFRERYGASAAYLTPSCAQSFYLAVALLDLKPEDEIILPSYTHPSTANAFAAAGAALCFVDMSHRAPLIDVAQIQSAITSRTKAVVAVHYGGDAADMLQLEELCKKKDCLLIEDTAHALLGKQKGRLMGSFGQMACFSFESQKNISCGEGGALLIYEPKLAAKAETIYEAGTNKSAYLRGEVEEYTWCSLGAKYIPSELVAAQLLAGLQAAPKLLQLRRSLWYLYHNALQALSLPLRLPDPIDKEHSAHLYYLVLESKAQRLALQSYLAQAGIETRTHYVPLHSSPYGRRYHFVGTGKYTQAVADGLLRLPLHEGLVSEDIEYVTEQIAAFFKK